MKKFQNQSLSKTEMNHIRGGHSYYACTCHFTEAVQTWLMPKDASLAEMSGAINSRCSKGGSCGKV